MKALSAEGWLFSLLGAMVLLVVVGSIWVPTMTDTDRSPTTYNNGSAGTKAAYLLLQKLGYRVERWEHPTAQLDGLHAADTTLVLAGPYRQDELHPELAVTRFLSNGGRVLATDLSGAMLLPESHAAASHRVYTGLCLTTPASLSAMGRAGAVEMRNDAQWLHSDAKARVQQWCGDEAAVIAYSYGKGEVIWWASTTPLSNAGLRNDASLKLLLAAVGDRNRIVIFDEYVHGMRDEVWGTMRATPVWILLAQVALIAVLMLLSLSRQHGPVRERVLPRRTSPVEFALSMGGLYERAHATQVATGAARQRVLASLEHEAGLPREVVRSSPEAIADAIEARFGSDGRSLADTLRAADAAQHSTLSGRSALALVRALDQQVKALRRIAAPRKRGDRNT
ncbi:MAG: DUF4350 domain-containing protein [Acidobacteriaceae bacterium]